MAANVADQRPAGEAGLKDIFSQLFENVLSGIRKSELLGRGCLTEHDAVIEILTELTSLPLGPERLARVQQLSGSQFLGLLDDCKTQLAQLGLATTDHPETDPE